MAKLEIDRNRSERSWSRREQLARVAWVLMFPLFSLSPRPLWGWRRWLLRCFGARIGAQVHIYPSVRIIIPWNLHLGSHCAVGDRAILYALGTISIGPRATVSQGAHLCAGTHDLEQLHRPLVKAPISVGADAWVAADAFVGPGVIIGANSVIGARCVVTKDVESGSVVVGNPAQLIKKERL